MTEQTFDEATKALTTGMARRGAVQGVAGLAALSLALAQGDADAKRKNKNKRNRKDNDKDRKKDKDKKQGNGGAGAEKKGKNKGKNKGQAKGTLIRTEFASVTESIEPSEQGTISAVCPEPGNKETVVVLSGGVTLSNVNLLLVAFGPVQNEATYAAEVQNNEESAQDATVEALCGYFRT